MGYGVPHMILVLVGVVAIHQHIVGPLKRTALHKTETPIELVELGKVDAGNVIEHARSLHENAGGGGDVWLDVNNLRYYFGAHIDTEIEHRTAGGADDDIGANASRTPGLLVQHSRAEANQREHHGDLNANGDDAQRGSHRPVL